MTSTTPTETTPALPRALAALREDFLELEVPDRLQLLLELSRGLPELPERYLLHPGLLEKVEECQSPVRVLAEVSGDRVHLVAAAPPEAPTTRGFAAILTEGLEGASTAEVLAVPDDFPFTIGLTAAITPLRLHGMTGMLARIKRQVRDHLALTAS